MRFHEEHVSDLSFDEDTEIYTFRLVSWDLTNWASSKSQYVSQYFDEFSMNSKTSQPFTLML